MYEENDFLPGEKEVVIKDRKHDIEELCHTSGVKTQMKQFNKSTKRTSRVNRISQRMSECAGLGLVQI